MTDKPLSPDETSRLNAFVDDLADLAADLYLEGDLMLRQVRTQASSKPLKGSRSKAAPTDPGGSGRR